MNNFHRNCFACRHRRQPHQSRFWVKDVRCRLPDAANYDITYPLSKLFEDVVLLCDVFVNLCSVLIDVGHFCSNRIPDSNYSQESPNKKFFEVKDDSLQKH